MDEVQKADDLIAPSLRKTLESEHGEIIAVQSIAGVAVFRGLTLPEYQQYSARLYSEKDRARAGELAARVACVHPSIEQYDMMVKRKPAIVTSFSNAVLALSGFEADPVTKKYSTVTE